MLKKEIKYIDFDGNEQVTTEYFNLSIMELVDFQEKAVPKESGCKDLAEYIDKIVSDQDVAGMFRLIRLIISKSYGLRSEDGKRFIKNKEVRSDFESSLAYDSLIQELLQDPNGNSMTAFIEGLINTIPKQPGDKSAFISGT